MRKIELSRRAMLHGLGGLGLVGAYGNSRGHSAASAGAWPQFGYDVANTGHPPDGTNIKAPVEQQWCFETDDGILSSPAVVDGTLYVGSNDGTVYALDAETGDERWRFPTDDTVWSSPTVVSDTVYVGSKDGFLYALRADDGNEQWRFETSGSVDSAPIVVDDTVYIGMNDVETGASLHAVSADTESSAWSISGFGTGTTVAFADNRVYVGTGSSDVRAYDADTGDEKWVFPTDDFVFSAPTIGDGLVYFGCNDNTVYAVDAASGAEEWQFVTTARVSGSPAFADGTVYVGAFGGIVYAIDAASGTERWQFETDDRLNSLPAVVADTVYLGDLDGNVYALDTADGTERWRVETDGAVFSSPAVVDGALYVGTSNNVCALTSGSSSDGGSGGSSIAITQTRNETTPRSPVTIQVDELLDEGYTYEWEVVDAPPGDDPYLLHEDRPDSKHVALTSYEDGPHKLRVEVRDSNGELVGTETVTIDVRDGDNADGKTAYDSIETYVDFDIDGVDSVAELAEMYAPVLHFHKDEKYLPTRFEAYFENARYESFDQPTDDEDETNVSVIENPSLADIGLAVDENWIVPTKKDRLYLEGDEDAVEQYQKEYPWTIYASATDTTFQPEDGPDSGQDDQYLALTYWFFYLFDPKSGVKEWLASHPSDTESVTILIDREGPKWIAAAQHYSGEYLKWERIADAGEPAHIDVYPAKDAHSTFLVNTRKYSTYDPEFDTSYIPPQPRWLPWFDDRSPLQSRSLGDVTGSQRTLTLDGDRGTGTYELLILPDDSIIGEGEERWLTLEGYFDGDVGDTSATEIFGSDGRLPTQRGDRWIDPGSWIPAWMLPEPDVLDVTTNPLVYTAFKRNDDGYISAIELQYFANPGVKPHTFVVGITVEEHELSRIRSKQEELSLGWNEVGSIEIPLDDDLESPASGQVTVGIEVHTYDPSVTSTEDVVYSDSISARMREETGLLFVEDRLGNIRQSQLNRLDSEEEPIRLLSHAESDTVGALNDTAGVDDVGPGDRVDRTVTLRNIGDTEHTFFIDFFAEGPDGRVYDNDGATGKTVPIPADGSEAVELSWTVEADVPEGTYDLVIEGWLESDPDRLVNLLARTREEEALTVTKPTGTLSVSSKPTGAVVTIGDESVDTTPFSIELPIGTYTLVAVHEDEAVPINETARVKEGETTNISIDLTNPDPGMLELDQFNGPSDVEAGTEFIISTMVTNVGDRSAEKPIEYRVDDQVVETDVIKIEGGLSNRVQFTPTVETPGTYTHGVYTDDDSVTANLTVLQGDRTGGGDVDEQQYGGTSASDDRGELFDAFGSKVNLGIAIAGLASVAYLLKRRLGDEMDREQ